MGSLSILSVVLNNLLREAGGTIAVTTYAYISKIITFAIMPFTAITQALSPIVGYNFGAGEAGTYPENHPLLYSGQPSLRFGPAAHYGGHAGFPHPLIH